MTPAWMLGSMSWALEMCDESFLGSCYAQEPSETVRWMTEQTERKVVAVAALVASVAVARMAVEVLVAAAAMSAVVVLEAVASLAAAEAVARTVVVVGQLAAVAMAEAEGFRSYQERYCTGKVESLRNPKRQHDP